MSEIVISEVLANADVHRLVDLRLGFLRLHKTLLEMERNSFQKAHGRVNSEELPATCLKNHEQFAWLRMVSVLVVQIGRDVGCRWTSYRRGRDQLDHRSSPTFYGI